MESELKEQKTIKDYLMANNEMILKIKYLARDIKEDLLGQKNDGDSELPSPLCMMSLLELENCVLRNAIDDLETIIKTLKPNN